MYSYTLSYVVETGPRSLIKRIKVLALRLMGRWIPSELKPVPTPYTVFMTSEYKLSDTELKNDILEKMGREILKLSKHIPKDQRINCMWFIGVTPINGERTTVTW